MEINWHVLQSVVVLASLLSTVTQADVINLSEELEEDGYFRKEHSLTKPYTGEWTASCVTVRIHTLKICDDSARDLHTLQALGWTYLTGTSLVVQ